MTLFGVLPDTPISTPSGPVPVASLVVGQPVWAWDSAAGRAVVRPVLRVDVGHCATLYDLRCASGRIAGATPGLLVYDAFEEMFRGVGSLSALTELVVWDSGAVRTEPMEDAVEETGAPREVRLPVLEGDEGSFFAGGLLVRHAVRQ
jgi:hypothetical protein